jgi:hypothetical protein
MTMVNLETLPADVYESLQRGAAMRQHSLPEELVHLLRKAIQREVDSPPAELISHEEISAPCDLPLPGQAVQVEAQPGEPPLPDLVGFQPE